MAYYTEYNWALPSREQNWRSFLSDNSGWLLRSIVVFAPATVGLLNGETSFLLYNLGPHHRRVKKQTPPTAYFILRLWMFQPQSIALIEKPTIYALNILIVIVSYNTLCLSLTTISKDIYLLFKRLCLPTSAGPSKK